MVVRFWILKYSLLITFVSCLKWAESLYNQKRKDARNEETVLTPNLKKYSTGSDFLCFFTVFFQINKAVQATFFIGV